MLNRAIRYLKFLRHVWFEQTTACCPLTPRIDRNTGKAIYLCSCRKEF